MTYSINQKVEWNWGNGTGTGRVIEVFESDVTRTIKGSEITRNATEACPTYLIQQDDGDHVLKSHSEVSGA